MSNTERIQTRIEPRLKKAAEKVFSQIGISPTEAIRLFYRQVELNKGLPFEAKIPNEELMEALRDVDERRNLTYYRDFEELLEDMGITLPKAKKSRKAKRAKKRA